ncbi:MAG: hypothetical protein MJK11_18055 [Pseudomonadales bacterium]|nr:hypothetical protein [Pseudomonadales bacterium]
MSMADFQGIWEPQATKPSDAKWSVKTEAIAYLYNYEWFKRHGAEGYTLFGSIVPIYGSKQLSSNVQLDIGAVGFLTYGDDNQNTIKPLFKLDIDLGHKKNLILGTLNQTHNIHPSLSLDNDLYKQQIEQGIQFTNSNPDNTIDTWVNWKVAETAETAEYFEVVALHNWTILKQDKYSLFSDEQVLIAHKGGQTTNDNSSIKGLWIQLGLGAIYNNQTFLIKLFNSSYADNFTATSTGIGLEATYSNQWNFKNNTQLTFKANHYVSDNFYNPTAHPGYNQKSFTQFNIDATWLRLDQLNISTGLSLDWINGSFSTIQYLNVSLLAI